jgi:hypothetical protein
MEPDKKQSLDKVLESAAVVSWTDLMRGVQTGMIHMEYGFTVSDTLDYLKVWSSITRGHWLLACSYWTSASTFHASGIHFENGYHSEGLAHILESVMQHQSAFILPSNLGRQGLLQIATPTEEDTARAAASVRNAYDCIESGIAQPV